MKIKIKISKDLAHNLARTQELEEVLTKKRIKDWQKEIKETLLNYANNIHLKIVTK